MNANAALRPLEIKSSLEEKFELGWTINFTKISFTRTPVFAPLKNAETKFYFEVWFQRQKVGSIDETLSLQVILRKVSESSVHSNVRLEFVVSVLTFHGSLYKDYKSAVDLAKFTEVTCVKTVFNVKKNISDYSTEGAMFSTNQLTLKCQMIFLGHILSPASYHIEINALDDMRKLRKNFEALYLSNELSDVSIQVGEKVFTSHKFVLAANSPVFKTMLMQDFKEAKTGVITISDFNPEVFESFLKFCYTGEVEDKSFSNFKELYFLADKYNIQILKEGCFKMLTDSTLNEDQIIEVLQTAHQYKDDNLKKAAKQLLLTAIKME